jgi:hypothetical protein
MIIMEVAGSAERGWAWRVSNLIILENIRIVLYIVTCIIGGHFRLPVIVQSLWVFKFSYA